MKYKCPITKEGDYDMEYCESVCFNDGCKHIKDCTAYQINKNANT